MIMTTLKLFGKRIKELRKRQKITQEQLGELVGIDSKQIGNIETGTYFTTISTLEKIAKILNVEIYELFEFSHQKDKKALIKEIITLLNSAPEEKIKTSYKVIKSIIH